MRHPELTRRPTTLEAAPKGDGRPRATRPSIGDAPGDDELLAAGAWQFPLERPRLPRELSGVRVLVVDDDQDTAELFAIALAACGADVVTAGTAFEALRVVGTRALDVVVTDIAMPGADGYWLLHEIRRLSDTSASGVPVLAVTAFGPQHFRARAMAAGFADHLEKPVDPGALCLAVSRATSG